jgi:hypothetical protein
MKGTPVTGVARRIDRACKHVSDLWFPADPGLVSRLRNTLAKDPSPSSIDETLEILSGDYSLYIFALKELVKILGDEGVAVSEIPSPREILEKAGLDTLRNVLNDSEDRLSQHSLDGMESAQVARMREALVSASASGTLANAQLQNQDLGFFTGLLRQLGLTLIAFNYPSVYQRATAAVRQGKEIDESITEILGFSPSTLAIALAKQWNLPAGLCSVLDDDPEDIDRDIETNALGRSLRELCRIGEALSRANEPETYPTARADWDFAERAITEKLGVNGLATIREAIEDRFEQLIVQAPSLFRGGTILDPEAFIAKHYEDEMGRHNPLVK